MESQTLRIFQGDAVVLEETITGLDSLDGYEAKLYITTQKGVEVDVLTGTIDELVVTYEVANEDSKVYPVGILEFETKIWDAGDNVFTPSKGKFIIDPVIENDPA